MANICMNCKADLREGAKFCQVCGTKVPVKQKSKISQAKFCIKCGAPLKKGAKFCTKCGAATVKKQTPRTKSPYRDTDVEIGKRSKETKNHVEDKIKKQAADLGKRTLTKLINQTLSASDTAGEMLIPMNDAQKSCLTDVIHEMAKMLVR
ncbi:MAG: zinc ribbon domain-containing protein [Tissierellia bacterium]|jgi:predicted amidophosphoribosyltransferase|nr:zinc ribbon domain-containing protein [Tissierellia bacterium]